MVEVSLETFQIEAVHTFQETFAYFWWYFWAPIIIGHLMRESTVARYICPAQILLLSGGISQILWLKFFSSGASCQIEQLLYGYFRKGDRNRWRFVGGVFGVLMGACTMAQVWRLLDSFFPRLLTISGKLSSPALPSLRSLKTGAQLLGSESASPMDELLEALTCEFLFSSLHAWSVILVADISTYERGDRARFNHRGLKEMRCFITPCLIYIGKTLKCGRPCINSSTALISGIMINTFAQNLLLAVVDLLATSNILFLLSLKEGGSFFERPKRKKSGSGPQLFIEESSSSSSSSSVMPSNSKRKAKLHQRS